MGKKIWKTKLTALEAQRISNKHSNFVFPNSILLITSGDVTDFCFHNSLAAQVMATPSPKGTLKFSKDKKTFLP